MAENNFSLQKTLTMLLDEKKYHSLRDILSTMNPADIAAIFDDLDQACLPLLFRLLPKELAAETFVEMEPEAQELLIRGFSDSELKEVIDELYVDDAVDIVEEMPANVVQRILSQAEPDMRKQINEILRYPEDSAGSIMTTEYVSLRPNMTVGEAILRIRRTGIDKETIYTCYVTETNRKLIGMISMRTLILADDDDVIEDIMESNVISANTLEDQESVAQMFTKYDFSALPVVDQENRLVGIVTVDDALDVLEEEHAEDLQIAGGTSSDADGTEHAHDLVWLLRRNAWFFFWIVATAIISFAFKTDTSTFTAALLACAAMPLALVVADDSVSYVTNFFLENDPDDEDSPSTLGFTLRSIGTGLVFAFICTLLVLAFVSLALPDASDAALAHALRLGFTAAAVSVLVSFALTPIYLVILRKRDERNQENSGFALAIIYMIVAAVVFAVAIAVTGTTGIVLG